MLRHKVPEEFYMKTRSLILFLLIAAIIMTSAWGVFCGVSLGAERFAPMEVLQGGADLQGEASIFLQLTPAEGVEVTEEQINEMTDILYARLDNQGFKQSSVMLIGENEFEVRLPVNTNSDFQDLDQIAEILYTVGNVNITEKSDKNAVLITREMIERVELQSNASGKFSFFLIMTDEGKEELEKVTTEISERKREDEKYVRVYVDDTQVSELSIRQPSTEGYFGFSSSYTEYKAERLANILNAGCLPVALETVAEENVSARMGIEAWDDMILCFGLVTAAMMFILVLVFRVSGLINALTLAAYQTALAVVLAALGIRLDGAGMACLAAVFGYLIVSLVYNNHAFKKQFEGGKNIRAAYKTAYTETTATVTNMGMILLVGFVALLASGTAALESMAYAYGVALLMAYLCVMLVNRMLFALMVRVTADKPALYFPVKKTTEGGNA